MKQAALYLAQLPTCVIEVVWENGVWTEAGSQGKGQSQVSYLCLINGVLVPWNW